MKKIQARSAANDINGEKVNWIMMDRYGLSLSVGNHWHLVATPRINEHGIAYLELILERPSDDREKVECV